MRDHGFRLKFQRSTFEIDTPMGPREVTYGQFAYYRDVLSMTYRSQNVLASHLDKLRKRIQQIEDEFQAKKAADALRKEVAKNPEEAVLLTIVGANARTNTPERLVLEEIQVRGVDQRSGKALITLADGSREQVSWGESRSYKRDVPDSYTGGEAVLRPLEPEDYADIRAAYARVAEAQGVETQARGLTMEQILPSDGIPDIEVSYDQATDERVAIYDGVTYRGRDNDHLAAQIWTVMLRAAGYGWEYGGKSDKKPSEINSEARFYGSNIYWKTREDIEAHRAAVKRVEEIKTVFHATVNDYLFDKTLVIPPEPAAEPTEVNENQVDLPNVHAPAKQDWDDEGKE